MNCNHFFNCVVLCLAVLLCLLPAGCSQQRPPLVSENPSTLQQPGQGQDEALEISNLSKYSPKMPSDVVTTENEFVSRELVSPSAAAEFMSKVSNDPNSTQSQSMRGQIYEISGRQDEALASFLAAIKLLERDRGTLRDENDRGSFMEGRIDSYYYAILQLLERRHYAEAFDLLERSRARALADLLASRPAGPTKPEDQARYGEINLLKARIAAKRTEITEDMRRGDDPQAKEAIRHAVTEVEKLENQLAKLKEGLEKESPNQGELRDSPPPVSLKQLQQSMKTEGFEMLQYLVWKTSVIVWHISADQIHVVKVDLPRYILQEKVQNFYNNLTNPERPNDPQVPFDEQAAREFYLFLVNPVSQWIKSKRLVIVPHEDLFSVPFQVFLNQKDNRFLGEDYQISYAPSATVLQGRHKSGPIAGGKLLVVSNPEFASEAETVANYYPRNSKILKDSLAQETEVKSLVDDFDLVHLSVHGKYISKAPMLSRLIFSSGESDDGNLTAAEMFGLPLGKCKLIVLSACESGRAEVSDGNEVQGIMRGLLVAGANSLLMSYWQVNAEATVQWMDTFYKIAQTQPPAEAARQAMQAVKSQVRYVHPYYWAGFMLVGK